MRTGVKKAAAALAFFAVLLCAGCGGTTAQTAAPEPTNRLADDDTSEDEILLDDGEEDLLIDGEFGDWLVEEGEYIEDASSDDPFDTDDEDEDDDEDDDDDDDDDDNGDDEDDVGEVSVTVTGDAGSGLADELIGKLQENGQVIFSDDYCQIRYFGETKDDDGNLIYVLGYKKFHGGLIRFNKADFKLGSAVDYMYPLWFSPMNELTDGYLCMSGAHGAEFYENPADAWWKDNGFIYLCCPKAYGNEEEIWSSYSYRDCEFMKYDDSVYDSISTIELYFGELVIQEGVSGDADGNAPHFDEPTDKNTHRCAVDLSSPGIRVRFDPGKVDVWAHT